MHMIKNQVIVNFKKGDKASVRCLYGFNQNKAFIGFCEVEDQYKGIVKKGSSSNRNCINDVCDVCLTFEDTTSIDGVIEILKTIRSQMD